MNLLIVALLFVSCRARKFQIAPAKLQAFSRPSADNGAPPSCRNAERTLQFNAATVAFTRHALLPLLLPAPSTPAGQSKHTQLAEHVPATAQRPAPSKQPSCRQRCPRQAPPSHSCNFFTLFQAWAAVSQHGRRAAAGDACPGAPLLPALPARLPVPHALPGRLLPACSALTEQPQLCAHIPPAPRRGSLPPPHAALVALLARRSAVKEGIGDWRPETMAQTTKPAQ